MKRDSAACLADMLEYARDAQSFVSGMDFHAFAADRKTQYAVLRALEVIGEAAKRVPDDVRQRFPDIPWRQIIGMRNIIAHDYLGIRLSRVYATAVDFLPVLVVRLPAMIEDLSQ
ncbi:MAG: DUF86 domain-containing protein [Magnetospirillum gryphiswaldense]|nr:DUF86 domain-containing protein [Magnetospirillum gryphiswaldense]